MADFDWNDGPLEFVTHDQVHSNIVIDHGDYGITDILNTAGSKIGCVWTESGDSQSRPGGKGKEFVRKVVDPVALMTDQEVADLYRVADANLLKLFEELEKRGYQMMTESGFRIETVELGSIEKVIYL